MNERLTAAVDALLRDRRLTSRFRRDPDRALRRFGLGPTELEAVKRGDAAELVQLGLDPRAVWPENDGQWVRRWILRNAGRVSPAVFAAALLAAPAAVGARATPTRARRVVRCAFGARAGRARCIRAIRVDRITIFTRTDLKDACKKGGFTLTAARNQGRCVSTVNHVFPEGVTLEPDDGGVD
jgi:hypothetical protein